MVFYEDHKWRPQLYSVCYYCEIAIHKYAVIFIKALQT